MILFFLFLNVIIVKTAPTPSTPPANTLYIPDLREMELVLYFQKKTSIDLTGYDPDFMKIDVQIGRTKIRYHFGHNGKVGRCDIFLNDHWPETDLFKLDSKLTITFSQKKNSRTTETKIHDKEIFIKANPNSFEQIYEFQDTEFKFVVKLRLTCDTQFQSLNCAFKSDEGQTDDLKKDPFTGKYICKEPTTCLASVKCDVGEGSCGDGGQCWKNTKAQGDFHCECKSGFAGKNCEIKEPDLTEELMLFAPETDLPNLIDESNCSPCPDSCQKLATFTICTSAGSEENAFICDGECQNVCGQRFCRNKKEDNSIVYYLKELDPNNSE